MSNEVKMKISTLNDFFDIIEELISDPSKFDKMPDNMIFAKDYATLHKILTEKRLELIDAIKEHPKENIDSLSKILKRKREAISRDLRILQSMGIINMKTIGKNKIPFVQKQYIVVPLT
jgi:predicted transcriptional regulator